VEIKKKQAVKIFKLLEEWTRAEIMARHGFARNLDFGDFYMEKLEIENQIRELIYGTSNLIRLGEEWGLLKPPMPDHVRKKKLKKRMKETCLYEGTKRKIKTTMDKIK
jgi:hypothetical protein